MRVKLIVSPAERTAMVAALLDYDPGFRALAERIATAPEFDPADDGPEVAILSVDREVRQ